MADLDGDGHLDLLSGSWPGEIFFFKGGPKRTFAAPVKLKDKAGKTINVGGGRRNDGGDMILIAGDATFEKDKDGKNIIVYEGEKIVVPEGKSAGITGTASSVQVADWDGDGLLDLIVGEIGGHVFFLKNEGTKTQYAFAKEQQLMAGGKAVQVNGGDAGPCCCDWDGDGKLDLLVGAGDGSVWFYRNEGSAKEPKLAAGEELLPPGDSSYGANAPKGPRRGSRAKVCAVDWNGDGRLDLLVGDFATQKPDRPEPTAAEKAEHDKVRKELDAVRKTWSGLMEKVHGPKAIKDKEEREKAMKEYRTAMEKMSALQQKLPPETEQHGWVWLFERRPVAANAGDAGARPVERRR